jgi:hypothetical protein
MRDVIVLLIHLVTTVFRLAGLGGLRSCSKGDCKNDPLSSFVGLEFARAFEEECLSGMVFV